MTLDSVQQAMEFQRVGEAGGRMHAVSSDQPCAWARGQEAMDGFLVKDGETLAL
jgi:hypothetical protein